MYKIKFTQRLEPNALGDEAQTVFFDQTFCDADIPSMADKWRGMGFKRVVSIDVIETKDMPKPKRTVQDIIKMFYAEEKIVNGVKVVIDLIPEEKKIKKDLLDKYSPQKEEPVQDITPEREQLLAQAKELNVKVHHMHSDETIQKNIEKKLANDNN